MMSSPTLTHTPEIHVPKALSAYQLDFGNSSLSIGQVFRSPRRLTAKTEQNLLGSRSRHLDLRNLVRIGRKITSDTKGDFEQISSFADIEPLFGEAVDFDIAPPVKRHSSNEMANESERVGLFRHDLEEIDEQTALLLQSAIEYGDDFDLDLVRAALGSKRLSASHMTSICEVLGRSKSTISKNRALTLMLELLVSPIPHVRDSALVGLALLDDVRAIPRLTEFVCVESNRLIREAAVAVISQLSEHA